MVLVTVINNQDSFWKSLADERNYNEVNKANFNIVKHCSMFDGTICVVSSRALSLNDISIYLFT